MLDSTPEKKKQKSKDEPLPPLLPPVQNHDSLWFTGSIILHLLVVTILWFTPVRQMILPKYDPKDFEITARAERISEMVEHLRERERILIEEYLDELRRIQEEMIDILESDQATYEDLAQDLAKDAAFRALEAQQKAKTAQQETLNAQQEVTSKAGDEAKNAHTRAQDAQAKAGDAQREAEQALEFTSTAFEKVRQIQTQANDMQRQASQSQGRIGELQTDAPYLHNTAQSLTEQVAKTQEQARQEQEKVKPFEEKLQAARNAVPPAEEALKAAENKTREARELAKTNNDARSEADKAQREEQDVKRQLEQTKRKQQDAERELNSAQRRAQDAQKRAEDADKRAQQARQRNDEQKKEIAKVQNEGMELQRRAEKLQDEAIEALKQAVAANAGQENTRPPAVAEIQKFDRPSPQVEHKNLAEAYQASVTAEEQIAETYKHVHATKVAMIRQVPVKDALAETVVAKTTRPALDENLLKKNVRTASGAREHRAEVEKATMEVESMVAASDRLLRMAKQSTGSDDAGASVSLASVKAAGEQDKKLRELAMEDESKRFKDLASAMQAATPAAPGGGSDRPRKATPQPDPYPDLGPTPRDVIPGRAIVTSGDRPKVLVSGGKDSKPQWISAKWMYVDSWYTIGPFPNPGRRNIDTQFPPESVIDLDATYVGKDGKQVSWQFLNSTSPGIFPNNDQEYGIYYAYTEIWMEEAMDLVVAVGSDDNSRIWVEDKQVWISGRELKSWRANEGFRTIHFKKGLNRILYRVENGWRETLYSFMICLQKR